MAGQLKFYTTAQPCVTSAPDLHLSEYSNKKWMYALSSLLVLPTS